MSDANNSSEDEENINKLNSIDINIKDKDKDKDKDSSFSDFLFSNTLNYDEEETTELINKKISLYMKRKNKIIISLIIVIIILIILIGIILFLILYQKSKCPKLCHCNENDGICNYCTKENYIVFENRCLLDNFTFIAKYHSKEQQKIDLINPIYKENITKLRIENDEGEIIKNIINQKK